jgi:hypothetical protein
MPSVKSRGRVCIWIWHRVQEQEWVRLVREPVFLIGTSWTLTLLIAQVPVPGLHRNGATTKTTVVFFLGGCTFTEIAALRWMGKQTRGPFFTSHSSVLAFVVFICSNNVPLMVTLTFPLLIGRRFLIATTGIINGNTLVDAFGGAAGPAKD